MRKLCFFSNNWKKKSAVFTFWTKSPYEKAVVSDCIMQAYQFFSGLDRTLFMSQKDAEVPQKYAENGNHVDSYSVTSSMTPREDLSG